MCLAVPGVVVEVADEGEPGARMAKVDFHGACVPASLMFTPDAGVGDWVLVHAGFAIRRLDPVEARATWDDLEAAGMTGNPEDEFGALP